MLALLQFFVFMCMMRIGPEQAPKSSVLVVLLLVGNLTAQVIYFMLNPSVNMTGLLAIGWSVLIVAISSLVLFGLLRVGGYQERFTKTFSAIQGCDLALTLPRIGLLLLHGTLPPDSKIGGALLLAGSLIQMYTILVFGFILQRSFEVRLLVGVGIALFLALLAAMGAAILLPLPELTDPELLERLTESGLLQPK